MAQVVTVFGGDGFVGRYVVQALLHSGAQVRVASRNPKRGWFLKAQADLGQIAFIAADVTKPERLEAAVNGADAVINLVGSFANVDAVQAVGAGNVARAATAARVHSLIHVSAIGADVDSPSRYGRSKGEGEVAVRDAFPTATILRPSLIFGREDQFINRFAGLIGMLPIVPVFAGDAKFQPVFVGDVAHAVILALAGEGGKTLELGGPEIFSMTQINRWIARTTRHNARFLAAPNFAGAAIARLTGWLPAAPITWDQWLMLGKDNIVSGEDGLAALGISPTSLDVAARGWLVLYRKQGRFSSKGVA